MKVVEKESDIQRGIIDYLQLRGFIALKYNSTQYGQRDGKSFAFTSGRPGVSDIIACSPTGRFLAAEVKRPGGKPTDAQVDFIREVSSKHGIAAVVYSIGDIIKLCEKHPELFREPTGEGSIQAVHVPEPSVQTPS